jgi:hypothetical protein
MPETNPDPIQGLVNNFNIDLFERQNCNFVLVHYLLGTKNNPYALRRTKVYVKEDNSMLEEILSLDESISSDNVNRMVKHEKALNEYIQYLDREHTFLKLIVDKTIKEISSKLNYCNKLDVSYCKTELKINEARETTRKNRHFDVDKDSSSANITWMLSKAAVNILAPRKLIQNFFIEVYEGAVDDKWERQFELLKSILIGKIFNLKSDFSEQDNIQKLQSTWNILSSIQSALIYSTAVSVVQENKARKNYSKLSYSTFTIVNSKNLKTPDNTVAVESIVIIASPILIDPNIMPILLESRRIFDATKINRETNSSSSSIKNFVEIYNANTSKDRKKFWKYIEKKLQEIFYHKDSSLSDITAWLILLTTYLTHQKHEGKMLDFFFIYGDLSQFNDLKMYREIKQEQLGEFQIPPNPKDSNFLEKTKALAIKIANEHYPWFENGRYALFWNTASKDSHPIGLVLIKNFTWLQVLKNRFVDELPFKIPNCFITYVYGEGQKIGSISVVERRVEDILLYKDQKWIPYELIETRKSQLKSELMEILSISENSSKDKPLSETIKLALQIADNPKKGGIIVFVNQEEEKEIMKKFKSMGDSWKPTSGNELLEDVVALISQDGATLRILDNDEKESDSWKYRNFLIPSNQTIKLLNQIKNECDKKHSGNEWPLIAKGSRRWSAAMTACHPDVDAVLVISQDGDIQLWHIKNSNYKFNRRETKVKVIEFPIRGGREFLIEYPRVSASQTLLTS